MIPAGLLEKYPRERVLKFLRRLAAAPGGRTNTGLSVFVLDLELYGLVRVPSARWAVGAVQITQGGRTAAAMDGWKPLKRI